MQGSKTVIWEGFTNSWEKKRSERQRRKGKIYPTEGFHGGSDDKESAYNVGDQSSIPGLGRSPGEGNGYTLQ